MNIAIESARRPRITARAKAKSERLTRTNQDIERRSLLVQASVAWFLAATAVFLTVLIART